MSIELQDFGVAFGELVVLASVDLTIRSPGITVLVGPAGSGKSTLLRTLAGLNDAQPSLRVWGSAQLEGAPVSQDNRPTLVKQNVRLLSVSLRENLVSAIPNRSERTKSEQDAVVEQALVSRGLSHLLTAMGKNVATLSLLDQRLISIIRSLLREPRALFVDEPMTGLSPEDANTLIQLLLDEAASRCVLVVTHNQRYAHALSGNIALLGGGQIQAATTTEKFFANADDHPLVAEFLRTGRLGLPSPNANPRDLNPDAPKPAATTAVAAQTRSAPLAGGPRGFCWMIPDKLGGC
ncbi:MAG: ATP-binding cassette domain-containing protein, partial [Myxococcota bacterium]